MKTWFTKLVLVLIAGVASLGMFPNSAAALTPPQALEIQTPVPVAIAPAVPDFSDAEFVQADQRELGDRTGGDAGGLLVFLLVVILLVLLILWLVNNGSVR